MTGQGVRARPPDARTFSGRVRVSTARASSVCPVTAGGRPLRRPVSPLPPCVASLRQVIGLTGSGDRRGTGIGDRLCRSAHPDPRAARGRRRRGVPSPRGPTGTAPGADPWLEVDDLDAESRTPEGVVRPVAGAGVAVEGREALGEGASRAGGRVTALALVRRPHRSPACVFARNVRLAGIERFTLSGRRAACGTWRWSYRSRRPRSIRCRHRTADRRACAGAARRGRDTPARHAPRGLYPPVALHRAATCIRRVSCVIGSCYEYRVLLGVRNDAKASVRPVRQRHSG